MRVKTKRIYDAYSKQDGTRVLVDGVWPRGVKKADAAIDLWLKQIAPSKSLRQWFGHDPDKWPAFQKSYFAELDQMPETLDQLRSAMRGKTLTLVYAAKDREHNNAAALKNYLEQHAADA